MPSAPLCHVERTPLCHVERSRDIYTPIALLVPSTTLGMTRGDYTRDDTAETIAYYQLYISRPPLGEGWGGGFYKKGGGTLTCTAPE